MDIRPTASLEALPSPRSRVRVKTDLEKDTEAGMDRHARHHNSAHASTSGLDSDHEVLKPHAAAARAQSAQWDRMLGAAVLGGATLSAYAIVTCLRSASLDHLELFHIYYQPMLVMLAMLWLWAIDVRIFERRRIAYGVCFSPQDQQYLRSSHQLFQVAAVLTCAIMGSATLFTYHCALGQLWAASLHPPLMYSLLVLLFLPLPLNFLFPETRQFFARTLYRVATPVREVTWADFLLADILTSLAKALSDLERAMCHMLSGPVMQPHTSDQVCSSSSWIIPLGLALPYAWRLCQCIRVYRDTGVRTNLFNALKYSTAFPVIIFSAMKYQVPVEDWHGFYKPLWLAAALLNSSYSYFWDIERDWDIQWFTAPGERRCGLPRPVLRSELFFQRAFYYYLMASNLLLRLAWTYKLSPHLRRNHDTVLAFTLLEAFRRFQWVPVRVEVELRKLQHARPELGQLVPAPAADRAGAKPLDKRGLLSGEDP
ncbi:g8598 [Coccomyxa elongata]